METSIGGQRVLLGLDRWIHSMVKGCAKSTVYAYRVTCIMFWHSGKRRFNTVDVCGTLQLVVTLRRDLAQQNEQGFCTTTIQTGILKVVQPSPFLTATKILLYIYIYTYTHMHTPLQFFTGQRENLL